MNTYAQYVILYYQLYLGCHMECSSILRMWM